MTVSTAAPGRVPGERVLKLREGAEEHPELEILLEAAAAAIGTFRDPDGDPVPGASLVLEGR